ncbi:LPXTG cell wall anchor domain-containing protein [Kribbella sp. NPDC051770]|uniref:LPXTG cell wall anchor domain-containing protein n=1 Tax=Kribbella sp. NPDC051770 TaxID=3155413 RepID=UPI00343DAE0E
MRLTYACVAGLLVGGIWGIWSVANAAPAATGPQGQVVTVSRSQGLDPAGTSVTVRGRGFDLNKGIYVAFCVNKGPGQLPSPCLGGVDMQGASGTSAWISSNPPSYGEGLATPFTRSGGKGSFEVRLTVKAKDQFTNCLDQKVAPNGCVIGTRADHTRTADRTADVLIPVSFAGAGSSKPSATPTSSTTLAKPTVTDDKTTPVKQQQGGPLANTGGTTMSLLVAAAVLAVVGTTTILATRRRKEPTA